MGVGNMQLTARKMFSITHISHNKHRRSGTIYRILLELTDPNYYV